MAVEAKPPVGAQLGDTGGEYAGVGDGAVEQDAELQGAPNRVVPLVGGERSSRRRTTVSTDAPREACRTSTVSGARRCRQCTAAVAMSRAVLDMATGPCHERAVRVRVCAVCRAGHSAIASPASVLNRCSQLSPWFKARKLAGSSLPATNRPYTNVSP